MRFAREMRCKHFTGLQRGTCGAGVAYVSVRDDSAKGPFRWPCLEECAVSCKSKELLTKAEIEAEEKKIEQLFSAMTKTRSAIVSLGIRLGFVDCALCGKVGSVRFSIASNGHIHAACSEPNCLRWME